MISFSSKSLAWIGLLTSIVGDDPWAIVARPACTASRQDMARDTLQTQIASGEYDFSPVEGNGEVLSAPNRSQELRSRVSAGGIQLFPRSTAADGKGAPWTLGVRTRSLLRGSSEFALSIPEVAVLGGRATLDHGPFVEWFENRPGGIQQGWIIERRPTGDGELRIVVELEGGFEARIEDQGRSAVFECAGFTLPYRDLRAWDADGRDLPARIVGGGRRIEIEVEDEGASYPLTIDPVLSWMAEGNQAGAGLGISVSSAGDVNGDGYDDVIAGAWHYDNGQTDEGRVFLFLGSASGLSATYAWSQEGNQASAIYGYSVSSAGDVDDDGDDEILVGAPFYDNGQVDEGRAFLYLGSPTGPSSSADWTAEGDLAGANFGVSVATAGDVDGDDHSDLIVGAYLYANGELQEGQAQVFLSPTGLPSASADWTAESDQAGAQLGNSVATAGDVDKDGFDDVIVGAPAYDNGQTDEGRAWLYMGSGSGLSATPA
jgi:hypothetical protein